MEPDRIWQVVTNPAWRPITDSDTPGYVFLLAAAAVLVGLTVWTYTGSSAASPKRVGTLIALRLVALVLAILLALRPAAAITEIPKLPSTLLIVVDSSESMSVKDEANFTRWEVVKRTLEKCGPLLDQMRDDQQTTVYVYHFDKDFDPDRDQMNDDVKPVGKRTDFGTMLSRLYDKHQGEPRLRGLIIVSDGADNGTAKPALPEASRWRGIGCPVYCFAVGGPTSTDQKDIGFTSISPDPSPVAIKADLKVRAKLNAPGFEGSTVPIELVVEGMAPQRRDFVLAKTTDNEVEFETKAPDQPGEYKVRMRLADPPLGQATELNDQIETFLTVTREGVRVLAITKIGNELAAIRSALAKDKRFDFVEITRASEAPGTPEEARAFDLREGRYDVILIGDVSPKMLTSVRPTILTEIRDMVRDKGVGLIMTAGAYSLGGTAGILGSEGWQSTPIAEILPVTLPALPPTLPDKPTPVEMAPTERGFEHYILRLAADGKRNREIWNLLNSPDKPGEPPMRLQWVTDIGEPKPNAATLARVDNGQTGKPLLVRWDVSEKGRVVAFGAGDTWHWHRKVKDGNDPDAAIKAFDRFWKQMVLWLAHQDETEGNVFVRPEFRRLVAGGRQAVRMGVRDKRGDEVPEAELRYQVLGPGEQPDKAKAKRPERDAKGARVQYEARQPGEYRVVAWGEATDPGGEKIEGEATARYVVYPDVSDEMLRPSAQPEFLLALQNTANGTADDSVPKADPGMRSRLEDMLTHPPQVAAPKPKPYPDWRRDKQKFFLPGVLILFVLILGLEWGLRRAWGMV